MQRPTLRQLIPVALLMALMTGCSDDEMIRRSLQYQAEQNAQMARHTQQVVETSRELVVLQQNLEEGVQTERKSLDRQHEEMEAERRTIAHQRHRDPLIAAAIINASILLACIAPLLLAFWVLRRSWDQESSGVDELLIHELTTDTPVLLPRPTLPMLPAETFPEPAGAIRGPTRPAVEA